MVAALHLCGAIESSLVLLLCFVGLLRIGEALALRVDDLVFCETAGRPSLVLLLRRTKQGPSESEKVVVTNMCVINVVRTFLQWRCGLPRLTSATYPSVSRDLARVSSLLGVGFAQFTTHSFRRGGASALALAGMPMQDIMMFGRWSSERSAKLYVKKGEVLVLRLERALPKHQWNRICWLSSLGETVFKLHMAVQRDHPAELAGGLTA